MVVLTGWGAGFEPLRLRSRRLTRRFDLNEIHHCFILPGLRILAYHRCGGSDVRQADPELGLRRVSGWLAAGRAYAADRRELADMADSSLDHAAALHDSPV